MMSVRSVQASPRRFFGCPMEAGTKSLLRRLRVFFTVLLLASGFGLGSCNSLFGPPSDQSLQRGLMQNEGEFATLELVSLSRTVLINDFRQSLRLHRQE